MKRLLKKLRERRGASLVFALLIFLMCALAGTVALTAASANVGRYTHLEAEQRDYLSVASALELIQKEMNDSFAPTVTVNYGKTETLDGLAAPAYTLTFSDPAASLISCSEYEKLLLLHSVPEEWYTATNGDGVSLQKTVVEAAVPASFPTNEAYRLHLDPGTPDPVWKDSLQDVVVVIDKDESYKLTMHFQVKRVDEATGDVTYSYPITVTWPGVVTTETTTEVETSEDGAGNGIRTTTTTLTCKLSWSAEDRAIEAG